MPAGYHYDMTTKACVPILAAMTALASCRGQQSEYEQRPTADTAASAALAADTGGQSTDSIAADTLIAPTGPETSSADSRAAGDTGFVGTTEPTHRARSAPPVAILSEVRAAEHAEYDRVVFEFAAAPLPGYHVEYATGPVYQCGSGDEVNVPDAAKLVVRLDPARAHDDSGNVTIADRQRMLALPALKRLLIICDFEAQVEWVLGVAARTPYRVSELSGPPRLVLDVRH
jgi:hypothetical protein